MLPPDTYRKLEAEFNQRQMTGEPSEGIRLAMVALLQRPLFGVGPDRSGLPLKEGETPAQHILRLVKSEAA